MTPASTTEMATRQRYCVAKGHTVPVAIQRLSEDREPACGELIDISDSGARIVSDALLRFGEEIVLHLELEENGSSMIRKCDVRWIRQGNGETQWTVGCLCQDSLEKDVLEGFVESGLLERRQSDRHDVLMPVSIKLEGADEEESDGDLHNFGMGGFCIRSPRSGEIGARVKITLEDADYDPADGRIIWITEEGGDYLMGCQWVDRHGIMISEHLSRAINDHPVGWRSWVVDHLLGVAIVAIVAFSLGLFLGTLNATFSASAGASESATNPG